MNKLRNGIFSLALAISATGCAALNVPHQTETVQVQPAIALMGNGMLAALQADNYPDFIRPFSRELKESVSETAFGKLNGSGKSDRDKIVQWQHLDSLNRGDVYMTEVWKVVLIRQTKNGKTNVERLFYVTTAKLDGKPQVIGFKFDPLF